MRTETIIEYVAEDGRRFRDARLCVAYEEELAKVEPIRARLPNTDLKHGTYVQHDVEELRQIRRDLWKLVVERYGKEWPGWQSLDPDTIHPMSGVGRVLSDYTGPVARTWAMLARFNFDNGREYDQPYFALHPEEASEAE